MGFLMGVKWIFSKLNFLKKLFDNLLFCHELPQGDFNDLAQYGLH
jgi:hypothetical protein